MRVGICVVPLMKTHASPQPTPEKTHDSSRASVIKALWVMVDGPKRLFTSKISGKCAAWIALLCSPSLLACALLSLPALIFQSPSQNAYFHFGRVVEQDPTRWLVFALAAVCVLIAPTLPATMEGPDLREDF